jgi:hypothetical protein
MTVSAGSIAGSETGVRQGGVRNLANGAMGVAVGRRVIITMRLVEDRYKERSTDKQQEQEQANGFSKSSKHEDFN